LEELRGAVVQHHAAAAIRAQLGRRDLTQKAFAERIGNAPERLNRLLNGAAVMQIHDIGNAAILGPETLPDAERVVRDVLRYGVTREERRRPGRPGGPVGFDPGDIGRTIHLMPVPVEPPPSPEELAARARVADAVRKILRAWIDAGHWPEAKGLDVTVDATIANDFWDVGGFALKGEGCVEALITVAADWEENVLPGEVSTPGVALILRAMEHPDGGIGLAMVDDLGTPILRACPLGRTPISS
jgi:hypothetical protein